MPKRIQQKRTKGWRMLEGAVSVCRPGKYGNPFVIGKPHPQTDLPMTHLQTLALHKQWCLEKLREDPAFLKPLEGKDLACFCALTEPCHADHYLQLLNQ